VDTAATGSGCASVTDLRALYAQQVAERGFRADPVQAAVVDRLSDLRQRLISAHEADSSRVRRWFSAFGGKTASEPVRGIYLWGGVGRGKTWIMDLFFQSLPFPERRRRHFHRFMHDVHAELKTLQQREAPLDVVADHIAQDTRVLCFDELFVADIADAMILGGLFAALFKRGVTLVSTSNVQPRDLYKNGLQRQRFIPTIELLEQHVDVVAVDGATDYRLRRLTQAGTYLSSSAPDTVQRLKELFGELADQHDPTASSATTSYNAGDPTASGAIASHNADSPTAGSAAASRNADGPTAGGGAASHNPGNPAASNATPNHNPGGPTTAGGTGHRPAARGESHAAPTTRVVNQSGRPWPRQDIDLANSIEIEGRRIPVVCESGGVVWFDFMALCSGPRSQDDYIEIARDYQSVIVSDVPVLDALHEDEARRFIALVDELYDRNVNLIVSAAAPPTELYRGDRVAFQFERTASRLIEMQSEEYLAREHRP
jgi:predicted ATPase